MAVARKMQDWVAAEISSRLAQHGSDLSASGKGKFFKGGWRRVSVDVHIESEAFGLVLALDPKHLNTFGKNALNCLNDLSAFSANLHGRFPLCVAGGIIGVREDLISSARLQDWYNILPRASGREAVYEQHALMETCGLAVYQCDPPQLHPQIPPPTGDLRKLRADYVFDRAVELLLRRHVV